MAAFATGLYDHEPFRASFDPFVSEVSAAGESAALGALLLRLTCPGIADIYQGDELWVLNLVDPDNRRQSLKLYVIREALTFALTTTRRVRGDLTYEAVAAPADVCAFTRGREVAVVVGLRADRRHQRDAAGG